MKMSYKFSNLSEPLIGVMQGRGLLWDNMYEELSQSR